MADPPSHVVEAAVALCREKQVEAVVSIGGGSALDTAKLVACLARSNDRLDDIYGVGLAKGPRLPLLLAPTGSPCSRDWVPEGLNAMEPRCQQRAFSRIARVHGLSRHLTAKISRLTLY